MAVVRNGIHPLDEELAGSGMLRWILPSLDVASPHVLTVLPASLILCALVLTARWWIPWSAKSTPWAGKPAPPWRTSRMKPRSPAWWP